MQKRSCPFGGVVCFRSFRGITVLRRNPHGANAASYLPHGMDAASGTNTQNFIFRNDYDFPIRIDASTHDLALFVAIYKEM